MKKVLDEGVEIINDVSGLNYDKNTLAVIKEYELLLCFNAFYEETPTTMQNQS